MRKRAYRPLPADTWKTRFLARMGQVAWVEPDPDPSWLTVGGQIIQGHYHREHLLAIRAAKELEALRKMEVA